MTEVPGLLGVYLVGFDGDEAIVKESWDLSVKDCRLLVGRWGTVEGELKFIKGEKVTTVDRIFRVPIQQWKDIQNADRTDQRGDATNTGQNAAEFKRT